MDLVFTPRVVVVVLALNAFSPGDGALSSPDTAASRHFMIREFYAARWFLSSLANHEPASEVGVSIPLWPVSTVPMFVSRPPVVGIAYV